jgi:hypothetical protein
MIHNHPTLMRPPLLTLVALASLITSAPLQSQASPGRAVLERMNATYAGKWYRSLTFVQKTTIYRPNSPERVATWWESLRYTPQHGVQLRIDSGDLTAGNGSLATADSTWIIRSGMLAQVRPAGNEFLPWIEGVYVQPLDVTERQVRAMGLDMQKTRKGTWRNRPVTILGASTAADTTHSQAWIDDERQVIVRMIVADSARPGVLDVLLDDYVRVGGGWLETKVDIYIDGVLRQREEYSDWQVDVPLPDALFDPTQWATAAHWAKKP